MLRPRLREAGQLLSVSGRGTLLINSTESTLRGAELALAAQAGGVWGAVRARRVAIVVLAALMPLGLVVSPLVLAAAATLVLGRACWLVG
jgi:hypothetical protein